MKRTVNKTSRQLFDHQDHLTMIKRVMHRLPRSTQIVENFETHIRQSVLKHVKNARKTHEGDVVQLHQTRSHITNNYEAAVTIAHQGTNSPATKLDLDGLYVEELGYQCIRIGPTALRPVITNSQSSPYTVKAAAGQTLTVPSATATDQLLVRDCQPSSRLALAPRDARDHLSLSNLRGGPVFRNSDNRGPGLLIPSCDTSRGVDRHDQHRRYVWKRRGRRCHGLGQP